jgi:hypothetical protein
MDRVIVSLAFCFDVTWVTTHRQRYLKLAEAEEFAS